MSVLPRELKTPPILIVIYTVFCILSLVFTNKIIEWHGVDISACLIVFPLLFLWGDVIAEVYGYKEAKKLIVYTIVGCLLFSLISMFIIRIPSAQFYNNNVAYQQVLGQDVKFTLVGVSAILISSIVNVYILTRWKFLLKGRYFWVRSIGSTAVGEGVNSLIAFPLGFLGTLNLHQIINITMVSYVIKMLYSILSVFPASILVNYLQRKENISPDEPLVKFNPFLTEE